MNVEWMRRLHAEGVPVAFEGLYKFPEPKLYNCGAIGSNGFIFNPNGEVHKCGLFVRARPRTPHAACSQTRARLGSIGAELPLVKKF